VTGELDKAARTYQEEIQSYPRELAAYGNLGVTCAAQDQYEKAKEMTRQGLALNPGNVAPRTNLANFALASQQLDEARQLIRES
jgi:Flp pilus assembly protein TadD